MITADEIRSSDVRQLIPRIEKALAGDKLKPAERAEYEALLGVLLHPLALHLFPSVVRPRRF